MEFNEIKDLVMDIGYNYCSLWKDGEAVESWNNQYMTTAEKLDQIEKRLKSQPTGTYLVKCRNAMKGKIDSFELDLKNGQTTLKEPPMPDINPKLLENQRILELSIANANLQKDNDRLLAEIADLEDLVADLENQLSSNQELLQENQQPTLMESAKGFVETLMEYGVPLLNQHWEIQKQKMELERMKYGIPTQPSPQAPDPEKVKIRIIGEWVESKRNDQDVYNALHDISARSKSVDQFMELLSQFNTDLYAELYEQI